MADIAHLQALAHNIRKNILDMTFHSGVNGGHLGGSLSCADILAVLYGAVLHIDPQHPTDPQRDRFLLSKGHVALAHYATLAECGFLTREEMLSFEKSGTLFPTHEVMNLEKGIETSSGSLGYGLSVGVGCALNAKRRGEPYRVYVLLGDGECNEGSVWEAMQAAVRFGLDQLVFVIDANGQQLDGFTRDVMPVADLAAACRAFGCNTVEVDGNDTSALLDALENHTVPNKPLAVVAHTKKGKGIPSIEGQTGWHHVRLSEEQYQQFQDELEGTVC